MTNLIKLFKAVWKPGLASGIAIVLAAFGVALSTWTASRRTTPLEVTAPRLSIADLVREVRKQIRITQEDVAKSNMKHLFYTRQLDLELNFVVKEAVDGSGGVELGLIDARSSGRFENSQIQKIHLIFDTVLSEDVRDYLALIEGYPTGDDQGFRESFRQDTLKGIHRHGGM